MPRSCWRWQAWRSSCSRVTSGRRHGFGGLIAIVGALTLLQHFAGADFGFNHQLTFGREWGHASTMIRGRFGPPAPASFTLIGTAFLLLALAEVPSRRDLCRFVPALGVSVGVITLFSLVGYLSAARPFYAIPWLTAIAFQTAVMLLAVAIALVASVREHQPMRLLLSSRAHPPDLAVHQQRRADGTRGRARGDAPSDRRPARLRRTRRDVPREAGDGVSRSLSAAPFRPDTGAAIVAPRPLVRPRHRCACTRAGDHCGLTA